MFAARFVAFIAISVFFARSFAWQQAWWRTMFHDGLEPDPIYARMKNQVFTRLWAGSAFAGALVTALAGGMQNQVVFICSMLGAIALVASVSAWRAAQLFNEAISELGWKYPPER
jgi:hypothetical protein